MENEQEKSDDELHQLLIITTKERQNLQQQLDHARVLLKKAAKMQVYQEADIDAREEIRAFLAREEGE